MLKPIIIVSGLPRSGTSMMMQMLIAGGIESFSDGKRAPDEDNPRGYFETEQATRLHKDSSWIPEARGKCVKIVAQLLPWLPEGEEYRVIFMQRDLDEVIASQSAMLTRSGRQGSDLDSTTLSRAYLKQIAGLEAWLGTYPHIRPTYVQTVKNPGDVARQIKIFLGGEFDEIQAANAVDATLQRQKKAY